MHCYHFSDIETAFDISTFESIKTAAMSLGILSTIIDWSINMLKLRLFIVTIREVSVYARVFEGCPKCAAFLLLY